jgi:hypothetical protein
MSHVDRPQVPATADQGRVGQPVLRSRRWLFGAMAVLVALLASSLSRPLSLSYPPLPAPPALPPLDVSVQMVSLAGGAPHLAVVHGSAVGSITYLLSYGSVLDLRGELTSEDGQPTRLIVRSDQALFVVDVQRIMGALNGRQDDDHPLLARPGFRILLATRNHAKVERPCLLLVTDGIARPLASSALERCGESG